ncbi:glycosyltransferase family 2 protein [Sphingomonas sp. H39-1-10]|uniref:glycosyltransferase family 2 protein n=1 Tax=Sphingomonas pollutisoli TaxID=3030829 RepID=UPI0023B8B56B|nr:glycosyltransferase family 2 protein [Sphingomonas pollutisoli]MDF0486563.1 glycosyltransferase family 2 protein [Sphingomonas pollutisoli]
MAVSPPDPRPTPEQAAPPRVAVIMTCYNEGPYIGAAVRSVLDQSRAAWIDAIVIADDGSDGETLAVLRDIETWDVRIRVLYGPGGVGLPGQRRKAIAETDAPVLAILDGDDLWTPDKLERQWPVLAEDTAIGLVYADFCVFPNQNLAAARRAGVLDITHDARLSRRYFLNDPPIIPSTTLLRRAAYDAAGGFDAAVRVFEDTDFYLRLARVTRFALVEAPLLYKRQRGSSITGGRADLMAHHAFVALKAAADEPALLPLVPRRLAERARKLGNQRFLLNDRAGAVRLLRLAVRLDPLNRRAWQSLLAATLFPALALRLLGSGGRARQAALGVS